MEDLTHQDFQAPLGAAATENEASAFSLDQRAWPEPSCPTDSPTPSINQQAPDGNEGSEVVDLDKNEGTDSSSTWTPEVLQLFFCYGLLHFCFFWASLIIHIVLLRIHHVLVFLIGFQFCSLETLLSAKNATVAGCITSWGPFAESSTKVVHEDFWWQLTWLCLISRLRPTLVRTLMIKWRCWFPELTIMKKKQIRRGWFNRVGELAAAVLSPVSSSSFSCERINTLVLSGSSWKKQTKQTVLCWLTDRSSWIIMTMCV